MYIGRPARLSGIGQLNLPPKICGSKHPSFVVGQDTSFPGRPKSRLTEPAAWPRMQDAAVLSKTSLVRTARLSGLDLLVVRFRPSQATASARRSNRSCALRSDAE